MSLLADMLSKVHQPAVKREVAPNLQNIVKAPSGLSVHKNKIVILSVVLIVCIMSGIFFVHYLNSISGQSDVIMASSSPDTARQDIRERQLPGRETQGLSNEASVDPEGKLQATQTVIKDEEPVSAITPEKSPAPAVVSAGEGKLQNSLSSQESPSEVVAEGGDSENAAINITADNPEKQVKEYEVVSRPVPLLNAEYKNTHGMDAYLYSAREDEMRGNYSGALSNYKKALELDRNNYAVMNNVAYIFLRLNLIDESIKYSRMAMDINGNYAPAMINLGIAYARSGDIASAEENLTSAFMLEPDNQDVLMNLAVLHERQERLQLAAEYFSRLVKLGSMHGSMGLARVYEKQGRPDEAVKLYRGVYDNASADEKLKSGARQRIMVLKNITKN